MAARAGSAVREIAASHAVHVSQPHATADLIRRASAMRAEEAQKGTPG
jgi:hypothetical protein